VISFVIPAIDIIDGKVVRLTQGSYDKVKEYSSDPVAMAKTFKDKGVDYIHVVDLDGAKAGKPVARIIPFVADDTSQRVPGIDMGKVINQPDFDAPLPEFDL